ncbi:acyltransferase family protein [Actinoplanes couchii]|uniref:Acyltransferase n=1 Tax=Actinoplanes couchii TaxID=403638 RepID=A0ABQ3X0Y3_9ACTN|nr:acyltransferase [Actinoplanes couchii]MDR6316548.1 peptidoglycan/LPS O-acetylase OafA/YrhL [Actinoplanes couchii]GID52162.1 acyltransferase [Actinoplanes couchii]
MTRLAWLDALRGWAAVVVAAFHLSPIVLGTAVHLEIFHTIDLGKYGVLLFFLVSGYVIPMSLERHGDLRRFWTGRLLRIYPAYLLAIAVTLALSAAGVLRLPAQLDTETTTSVLGHLTMLQDLLGTQGTLRPFWTLSFEMVFYLVVAGLFVLRRHGAAPWWAAGLTLLALTGLPDDLLGATAGQRRISAIVVTALMIAVLTTYTTGKLTLISGVTGLAVIVLPLLNGHATDQVTSASSAQAAQMLAVMFAGTVIHRVQHRRIGRTAAALVLSLVLGGVAIQVAPAVAVAVAATFTVAFALRERRIPAVLSWLGTISYSLYLLHIPVLVAVRQLTADPAVITVAFTCASLTLAWAGHRWVERPAQNLARRLPVIKVATQGTDARTPSFGKRYESV